MIFSFHQFFCTSKNNFYFKNNFSLQLQNEFTPFFAKFNFKIPTKINSLLLKDIHTINKQNNEQSNLSGKFFNFLSNDLHNRCCFSSSRWPMKNRDRKCCLYCKSDSSFLGIVKLLVEELIDFQRAVQTFSVYTLTWKQVFKELAAGI